jgi:hypothetical protein
MSSIDFGPQLPRASHFLCSRPTVRLYYSPRTNRLKQLQVGWAVVWRLSGARAFLRMRRLRRMRGNPTVASAVDTRYSNTSPPANSAKTPAPSAQPSPKMYSIAYEAAVTATGARPGKSGGQRELFTEETITILVFENGGVLRLTAGVVPGQLLFLTNKNTRREVVAQVTRKRDFRPTRCYVEVEFSEPSPGFWGIDFPETPQLAPANAQQREATELVHAAKVISGEPSAPAPSAQDVIALKQEVEALRNQLRLLQTQTIAVSSSAPAVAPDPQLALGAAEVHPELSPDLPGVAAEVSAIAAARISGALPTEPGGPSFSEEVDLPEPVIHVNRAKPKANRAPKPKETNGANARLAALRIALVCAPLLLGAAGAAWFLHWIPWLPQPKIISASGAPNGAPNAAVHAAPAAGPAASKLAAAHSNSGNTMPPNNVSTVQPVASLPGTSSQSAGSTAAPQFTSAPQQAGRFAPGGDSAKPSTLTKPQLPAPAGTAVDPVAVKEKPVLVASAARPSEPRPSIQTASISEALPSEGADIVPPKLTKSVRAIASPDALEYFARDKTATVTLDAVVDVTGRVKTMKVLTGPASLSQSAIAALKQYQYEPAKLRGKPVAAHVTVSVKFLFEP